MAPDHPHDTAFEGIPAATDLAALLPGLRAHIPPQLVDDARWERVRRRVGDLPAVAATAIVFEFRLGDADPAADVFVPVMPGGRLAGYFVRSGQAAASGSPEAAFGRYLGELADPASPLHRWISGTILEYDLVGTHADASPAPGVFMRMRLRPLPRPLSSSPYACSARHIAATLATTVGWTGNPAEEAAIERAFDAFAGDGEVLHVGALPGRRPRAVRLVARGVVEDKVLAVLARLGWTGSIPAVTALLPALRGRARRFYLSLDVSDRGVSPRLGLELYVDRDAVPGTPGGWVATGRSDWASFIAWLEQEGWCLPAKARALAQWPGIGTTYAFGRPCRLYRGLNHVKITIEADGTASAKAYAGMSFVPIA